MVRDVAIVKNFILNRASPCLFLSARDTAVKRGPSRGSIQVITIMEEVKNDLMILYIFSNIIIPPKDYSI